MKLLACLLLATGLVNNLKSRVINGEEVAPPHHYPWMASVQESGKASNPGWHLCGGSIITKRHVLTAAHCTYRRRAGDICVRVGAHDYRNTGRIHDIFMIIVHSMYKPYDFIFDMALLETATYMVFNARVGPIYIPNSKLNLEGQQVTAIGLGVNGSASNALHEVQVTVMKFTDCKRPWGFRLREDIHMCTYEVNKTICEGDSGGPLMWHHPSIKKYLQVGVVSYGPRQCDAPFPTVHTDVSLFIDWIDTKIRTTAPGVSTFRQV